MTSTDDSPRGDGGVMTSGPGSILAGRYRLDVRLGRGPLGELMRAEDLELGRPTAVRLVSPELSGSDELHARLELRRARNARLPRAEVPLLVDLVDLVDLGLDPRGRLFLVTDVFPSDSLADLLAREGPPPWQRLRSLMVRACQIVHLSHEHGMIRQDLSTSSLYPVRDKNDPGTLKVVSPGLLIASGGGVWSCGEPEAALALARYAAPEQISTGVLDRRTDVYALGVILYECLTGRVPFADPRPAHVLAAHLITPPPPFSAALRRKLPRELEAIVARALAKSPDDRWPTVMALANALATLEFGRCEFSGVLDSGDTDDFTEHLEPPRSATSMRVDAARLSGRAGLVPAADSSASHVWRDVLDAAESASGLRPTAASSSASLSRTGGSDSAITRISAVDDDGAPTLAYGHASESAARWVAPASASPPGRAPRRFAPWLLVGGLSVVTAGVVSVALRPAQQLARVEVIGLTASTSSDALAAAASLDARAPDPSPLAVLAPGAPAAGGASALADADATAGDSPGSGVGAAAIAPPIPAPSEAPPDAAPGPGEPPVPGAMPAAAPVLAPAPTPGPDPQLALPGSAALAPSSSPASADPRSSPSDPAVPPTAPSVPGDTSEVRQPPAPAAARPVARPKPPPLPRKTAPGARLPDRSGHELPDPAAPESASTGP